MQADNSSVDSRSQPTRWLHLDLFLLSLASLFFELLIIRWLTSEVRAFTIYKNFPLIACFVGLGGGFMIAGESKRLFRFFPLLLFLVLASIATCDWTGLSSAMAPSTRSEITFAWFDELHPPAAAVSNPLLFTALAFAGFFTSLILPALAFAAIGERLGQLFNLDKPLKSYLVNILGATAGIVAFSLLAFFCTPPVVWVAVGVVPLAWVLRRDKLGLVLLAACIAVAALVPNKGMPGQTSPDATRVETLWSPYHRVDLKPLYVQADPRQPSVLIGHHIAVNKAFFQQPLNLSPEFVAKLPDNSPVRDFLLDLYEFPYFFAQPRSVLVLGAGTGNDVASALRHGSGHVDAIEIDPLMVRLGQRLHPEKPYDSAQVRTIVNDARAFLRQSNAKYDLVVIGLLDSHTVAGNSLSVRLDDYVYTVDGLRDALSHLAPGGLFIASYATSSDWLAKRLVKNLQLAVGSNGEKPLVMRRETSGIWHLVAPVTPAVRERVPELVKIGFQDCSSLDTADTRPSTDDWPYLYMRTTEIDTNYLGVNLCVILLAWAACGPYVRRFQSPSRWHLFFLGAGFLLLELSIIDRLALIFGTTWIVNSVSIFGVMLAIFLSNLLVLKKPDVVRAMRPYLCLFLSLALLYVIPIHELNQLGVAWGGTAAAILSSVPIFFAGMIFSSSFAGEEKPSVGLAFNVLGAVVGGLLEYVATYTGIRSLLVVAAVLYGLSLLFVAYQGRLFVPGGKQQALDI